MLKDNPLYNAPEVSSGACAPMLVEALPEGASQLWTRYINWEGQGLRRPALAVLNQFIAALKALPQERQQAFAEALCRSVSDEGRNIPVRQPLFAGVLAPFLATAYRQGRPDTARWIAFLYDHFWTLPAQQRISGFPHLSRIGFLREALSHESGNQVVRERLIQRMADQFRYAVHDAPAGVIWGYNGATADQCRELLRELDEFRRLVHAQDKEAAYQELIAEWDFHFHGYADYQEHRDEYENYADYIQRHRDT